MPDMLDWYDRINRNNIKLGWSGPGVTGPTFPEAMMLIATEIAEAAEAWRKWGFDDATANHGKAIVVPGSECGKPPGMYMRGYEPAKPEGVGSEFADVVIRYLDDCGRFQMPFPKHIAWQLGEPSRAESSFFTECMALLVKVVRVVEAWESDGTLAVPWRNLWQLLLYTAKAHGIDLEAETMRKMAYNETREFRHGGKRL